MKPKLAIPSTEPAALIVTILKPRKRWLWRQFAKLIYAKGDLYDRY